MRCWIPGRWVIGIALGSSLGCAAGAGEHARLLAELDRAKHQALERQREVVELERRLGELERREAARVEPSGVSSLPQQLLRRLDLLAAQNQRLLELSAARTPAAESAPPASVEPGALHQCGEAIDPDEQLRRAVERLRNDPSRWRGGLSPTQNAAVNLLLRGRRSLDAQNPWDI